MQTVVLQKAPRSEGGAADDSTFQGTREKGDTQA